MKREICTVKEEVKNSASRQRPRIPLASGAKRHFFRVSIFVFKNRLKKWGMSRMALAAKIIFLLAVVSAGCPAFADCADCEAYKTQVVNDCDSLLSLIDSCQSESSAICIMSNNGATMTSGSSQGQDQQSNIYFTSIYSAASSISSSLSSLGSFVSSIRSTAQSLQCNASSNTVGSCDCAQYLQTLIGLVQTCNQSVTGIATGIDSIKSTLGEYNEGDDLMPIVGAVNDILNYGIYTYALLENFFEYSLQDGTPYKISDFYSVLSSLGKALTNQFLNVQSSTPSYTYAYRRMNSSMSSSQISLSSLSYFQNSTNGRKLSINEQIWYGNLVTLGALSSLNNYAYSNTFAIASIARKMDNLTNTTSNALLDYIVEVDRPPLLDSSSSDYFAALTNSYLATWSANDNPNTNWFRRVEILLASLVFKNYDNHDSLADSATNSISSFDTARSTFVDSVNAEDLFSFDLGSEYLDSPPSLPEFGDQLPDSLIITIPRYNDSNLNSETHNDQIEISGLNQYSTIFDLVRVFFRLVWWAIVVILVFICFKYFFAFCKFSFNLFTKFTFR